MVLNIYRINPDHSRRFLASERARPRSHSIINNSNAIAPFKNNKTAIALFKNNKTVIAEKKHFTKGGDRIN
jgi:hypothetical protein